MQDPTPETRLVTAEILRALERDHRDLFLSLRALAALLGEPDPATGEGEPVLGRILDAHVHQLGTVVGEITTALRIERDDVGAAKVVDLGRATETAVRRSARRVLAEISDEVAVEAHPQVVAQVIASVLSLALRAADGGRVTASAMKAGRDGVLVVRAPGRDAAGALDRSRARLDLLRRIVAAEGGRLTVSRSPDGAAMRLAFPGASAAQRKARRGRSA